MILNLFGITFHPVVVLGPEHDFLFKSASTYCGKTLTNTIFIGDSDLNGAGWFCSFSDIGHYSGSPAFQPFMPIEIFPDSSEPCENTDGQK